MVYFREGRCQPQSHTLIYARKLRCCEWCFLACIKTIPIFQRPFKRYPSLCWYYQAAMFRALLVSFRLGAVL